jgi:vancomycin resistance protein VanJ
VKLYRAFVRLLVMTAVLASCGAAVVVQLLGDRTALGTLALFAPRYLTLWPWALLVPLAATVSRRLLLGSVAGAAVTLFGVSGFVLPIRSLGSAELIASSPESPETPSPTPTPSTAPAAISSGATAELDTTPIRVVTYNTDRSDELPARIVRDLADWDADVVAMVECRSSIGRALRKARGFSVVEAPFLCFATRHQIVDYERLPDSLIAQRMGPPSGRAGRVYRFDLLVRGRPLSVYVLHLETPRAALYAARNFDLSLLEQNAEARGGDSQIASRWVDRRNPSLIVMGDFNLTVESRIYRRDWADLENAYSATGFGFGYTMFAGHYPVRIDHVLTGRALEATSVRILEGYPSQHQPVVADLRWR